MEQIRGGLCTYNERAGGPDQRETQEPNYNKISGQVGGIAVLTKLIVI